ncbi:guanine nucleotide binding protein, alpha subunit, partial [Stipitochalara longipes BDJ]
RNRNKLIERELEQHAKSLKRECKVLLLGDRNCAQTFLKSMKIVYSGGFTHEEREKYQRVVTNRIRNLMEIMAEILEDEVIDLDDTAKIHVKVLSQEIETMRTGDGRVTIEGAGAVQGLWEDEQLVKTFLHNKGSLPDSSPYFIKEIQRIAQHDYLPTDADILKLGSATPARAGIQEHRFTTGSLSLKMFDISLERSERKKWIHQFEGTISITFFVDLNQYDEIFLADDLTQNQMAMTLLLFESLVNSRWFSRASIILLLCNVGRFREKLRSKPLSNYFPEYSGGNDLNEASKYLLWRFSQLNRARLNFYPSLCERFDASTMCHVLTAVKETTLRDAI